MNNTFKNDLVLEIAKENVDRIRKSNADYWATSQILKTMASHLDISISIGESQSLKDCISSNVADIKSDLITEVVSKEALAQVDALNEKLDLAIKKQTELNRLQAPFKFCVIGQSGNPIDCFTISGAKYECIDNYLFIYDNSGEVMGQFPSSYGIYKF